MKFKKFIMEVWQLPQNILGYIVMKIIKARYYTDYEDATVYSWDIYGGMSLGKYIFVPFEKTSIELPRVRQYIQHEYGHTTQSKYLGWLYLFVIGLPSFIWASCFSKYRIKNNVSYYSFYTEKWADKLGGVER